MHAEWRADSLELTWLRRATPASVMHPPRMRSRKAVGGRLDRLGAARRPTAPARRKFRTVSDRTPRRQAVMAGLSLQVNLLPSLLGPLERVARRLHGLSVRVDSIIHGESLQLVCKRASSFVERAHVLRLSPFASPENVQSKCKMPGRRELERSPFGPRTPPTSMARVFRSPHAHGGHHLGP